MSQRLKVGVVGGGVGKGHVAAYRQFPDLYEVVAICDIDGERARAIAAEHGLAHTFTAFDDVLAADLDIVDICTPSGLHFSQAKAALEAGHHVVVEKPFVSSLAEADALAEAEARSGKRCSPIFQYRFSNGIRQFLHLRERGFVGRPYITTVETLWRRRATYYDNPWRGRWASELGGTLASHAIHNHDLLTYLLGPVKSLFARTATRVNAIETEDCAVLSFAMADGSFATSAVTTGAESDMSRFRFCFEGLTVESNHSPYNAGTAPWTFIAADPAHQKEIEDVAAEVEFLPERNAGQFMLLHTALTEGGPLPVAIADARHSIELLTAAYYSVQTGSDVPLPIGRDHPFYDGWLAAMKGRQG
jgi:predicted dehydrogenase